MRPALRPGLVTPALRATGSWSHSPTGEWRVRQDAERHRAFRALRVSRVRRDGEARRVFRAPRVLRVRQDVEAPRLEEPEFPRLEAAGRLRWLQDGSAPVSAGPPQPALKAGLGPARAG